LVSVTIYDVARVAGVSIKTVSRVLNREPNVRPATRERVTAAAAALHYRPNISARSLAGSRSYLLGLFYDNPSPAYVSDFQHGATAQCRKEGYHLVVEPIDSSAVDAGALVEGMLAMLKLDGVILTPPVCDRPAVLAVLDRMGVPYVRIAPDLNLNHAARVSMDDRRAAFEMTNLLFRLGHRDIGFIKGHPDHGASHLRFEGYEAAMTAQGAPIRADRVLQGYFSFRSGVDCAEQLLSSADRPTAIFASNDDMALGALTVASRQGLVAPRDLSVAGFDDTPSASVVWPKLTTVRQPIAEMAAAAAEILISRHMDDDNALPVDRLLDFKIIVRESTGAAPGAEHFQIANEE
jgi:LacI family transcriptional regulator